MDDIDKEKIFYVFIGIGLSLVAYFIFRQCKESQTQPQPLPLQSLSCAPQTCSPPPQACSSTCPPSPAYSNEHLLQLIENQQMQITSLTNHLLLKASPLKEEVLTPVPAIEPSPVESAKLMEESKLTSEKQKVLSKLNPLKDNIGKAVFGMH